MKFYRGRRDKDPVDQLSSSLKQVCIGTSTKAEVGACTCMGSASTERLSEQSKRKKDSRRRPTSIVSGRATEPLAMPTQLYTDALMWPIRRLCKCPTLRMDCCIHKKEFFNYMVCLPYLDEPLRRSEYIYQWGTTMDSGYYARWQGGIEPYVKFSELEPALMKLTIRKQKHLKKIQKFFLEAIRHNDISSVKEILKKYRLDPNFEHKKRIPICVASAIGDNEMLVELLDAGADPDVVDTSDLSWGRRPIHIATSKGHMKVMQVLVGYGVNINQSDKYQRTPLHWAAMFGQVHLIQWAFRLGAQMNLCTKDGFTPLHLATILGHKEACQYLIERGADMTIRDKDGWNPLHTAISYGYGEIVRLMLARGACPFARVSSNEDTTLHIACVKGLVDIIALFLRLGVPIESKNKYQFTPLQTAVFYSRIKPAFFLVKCGANVNTRHFTGILALYMAAMRADMSMVSLLISANCFISRGAAICLCHHNLPLARVACAKGDRPQSLRELSLLTIRQQLAPDLQMKAQKLPLPRLMIDEIVMKSLTMSNVTKYKSRRLF